MSPRVFFILVLVLSCAPSSEYHKQLTQLPEAQRDNYKILKYSIEALGSKSEIENFSRIVSTDSIALKQFEEFFWKKRDPNPLTLENEMKEEFDKRLQYVLDNFSSAQHFQPWDERGEAYLKLGRPTERRILPTAEDLIEEWVYDQIGNFGYPLTLRFAHSLVRGYVSIPVPTPLGQKEPNALTTMRQQHIITWVSQVEQKPMQYFYDYGKEELKYALGLTPFLMRETPNIYDIYLTINAPAEKLTIPTLDSLHYTWRVLVQDENYERLFQDSSESVSHFTSSPASLKDMVILDQKELRLKAGTYIITSELVNFDRTKGGMLQSQLILPPYVFPKEIEVSKAILTKEIRPADSTETKFVRNGLVIKPWPASTFTLHEPFWLYFEIYNIPLDREGMSHFKISYYLQDLDSNKKYLLSQRAYREPQRDYAIVQSFSDSLFQAAGIKLKTGKDYVLLTEVKDEVLGKDVRSLSGMFKFKKPS